MINEDSYTNLIYLFKIYCTQNEDGFCEAQEYKKCKWDIDYCIPYADESIFNKVSMKNTLMLFPNVIRKEKIKKLMNEDSD